MTWLTVRGLQSLAHVVDVVGGSAENLSPRVGVEVADGNARELGSHLSAQTGHRPLDDARREAPLKHPADAGGGVDEQGGD